MKIDLTFETEQTRIEVHVGNPSPMGNYAKIINLDTGKHVILDVDILLEVLVDFAAELRANGTLNGKPVRIQAPKGPGGIHHDE